METQQIWVETPWTTAQIHKATVLVLSQLMPSMAITSLALHVSLGAPAIKAEYMANLVEEMGKLFMNVATTMATTMAQQFTQVQGPLWPVAQPWDRNAPAFLAGGQSCSTAGSLAVTHTHAG